MANSETFHCSVVTPERAVLEAEATFVAFPAHDGEIGIMRNRAPLVCKMGIGTLRVETPGEKKVLFVDGGFAQMVNNRLTLLTEQAKTIDQLDAVVAKKSLTEARAMQVRDDASATARNNALRRAQVQLRLAQSNVR